jgi:hypothetical protein
MRLVHARLRNQRLGARTAVGRRDRVPVHRSARPDPGPVTLGFVTG